jgi:hypothetical protein
MELSLVASRAQCSGASQCRFFKKAASHIPMLCHALGRTDLVDKYHVALATHDGGEPGATTTPTPRETTIKALPDETVAAIQRLCKDKHAQFMSVTNKVPICAGA